MEPGMETEEGREDEWGEKGERDKTRERKGMQVSEEKRFWRLVRVREGNKSEGDKMGEDIPFTSGGVNLKTFRKKSGQKREHKIFPFTREKGRQCPDDISPKLQLQ